MQGFGWFPVEFTVPDTGAASAGYGDFLNALGRFFRPDEVPDASEQSTDIETPDIDPAGLLNLGETPAFMIFVWIIVIPMLIPLFKHAYNMFILFNRQRRSYLKGDYAPSVVYRYERASAKLRRLLRDERPELVANTFGLIDDILRNPEDTVSTASVRLNTSDHKKSLLKIRKRIMEYAGKENIGLDALCLMTQECFYSDKKPDKQTADLLIRFYKTI